MNYEEMVMNRRRPLGTNLARAGAILAGQKPSDDDDFIDKIYAREAIQNQFKNPLDDQLKEAQIGAYRSMATTPVPEGKVRWGNNLVDDPSFVKPKEQTPLNEAQEFELAQKKRANDNQANMVKGSAEDMLSTIGEIRKGMKYFGPLGSLPSEVSPSSLTGEYDQRKNWEANIDRLSSSKVLDVINEMKAASRTGATGFGQLSNKELGVLQNASTALKRTLGKNDADRYLTDIENSQKRILGMPVRQSFNSPEEADASGLPAGTIVKVQGRDYQI